MLVALVVPAMAIQPWCGSVEIFPYVNTSPTNPDYYQLVNHPPPASQTTTTITFNSADGDVLIGQYLSPPFEDGVIIDPALWRARTQHYIDSNVGTTQVVYKIYNYTSGGVEIGPLWYNEWSSDDIDGVTSIPQEHITNYARRNTTVLFPGDSLLLKMYGRTTRVTDVKLATITSGNVNTSYISAGYFEECDELVADSQSNGNEAIGILFGIVGGLLGGILILRRERKP